MNNIFSMLNSGQVIAQQQLTARDYANQMLSSARDQDIRNQMEAYKQAAAAAAVNQIHTQGLQLPRHATHDEQIESLKRQIRALEDLKIKDLAPTTDELETYPVLDSVWKEYVTVRNLTLGQK